MLGNFQKNSHCKRLLLHHLHTLSALYTFEHLLYIDMLVKRKNPSSDMKLTHCLQVFNNGEGFIERAQNATKRQRVKTDAGTGTS